MSWCGGGEISPTPAVAFRVCRDPRVDLGPGQLAALAGLRALRHLDLDLGGVHQERAGHPEPAGRDLLDRGPPHRVEQPLDILAALAGVRLAAEPVHRDGQRLVGLDRDGPVGHRAGDEPLDDLRGRFDLVQRHRRPLPRAQLEQPAQRGALAGQLVDGVGVAAEHLLLLAAGRVLQQVHGFRVEQVDLTLAAPLVLAADFQLAVFQGARVLHEGQRVPGGHVAGDGGQAAAAGAGGGAGEVLVQHVVVDAEHREHLGAAVGTDGGDAHLAHHLEHALAERVHGVPDGLLAA